ncbi:Kef-type K+ transport system, membrane component [Caldisphaera lagunensis DSM 15908]|uniref:Kef-type K+ transport system, membrane component n=1 Tax=Caldisphaera lagunensis (strain DSM 15908 / JCM 11604 / ANMR 0165 / IC-154) TaxID=1056495 RepID=L0AC73_CALLD|nr:cation:proton antiporter [Caldisphaera lagunensis]AFZ70630.1 Kef-type K+ transport system, membrane component [Caldisphaera lagunensis DSM 15908]
MISNTILSFLYIGLIILISKVLEEALKRFYVPAFVSIIVSGIILGPAVLKFIIPNQSINFLSQLGITFILFLAGVEEFTLDKKPNLRIFVSSLIQVFIPLIFILLLFKILNINEALILAIPLAMTSTGPLARALSEINISKTEIGNTLFYQAIITEIIFIVLFVGFSQKGRILEAFIGTSIVVIAIFALGQLYSKIFAKVMHILKAREIETALIISIILIVGYFSDYYGFNAAISALFLGYLFRDYFKDRPEIIERIRGITYGFFEPIFFADIGLEVVKITPDIVFISLSLIAIIMLTKILSGYLSANIIKLDDKWLNSWAQTAKGGVDTSLLLVSLLSGFINNQQYSFSVLAIAVVAILSPIFLRKYKIVGEEKMNIKLSMPLSSLKNDNYDIVYCDTSLSEVAKIFSKKDISEIIVVNRDKIPIGVFSVKNLIYIDSYNYESTIVCDTYLKPVDALLYNNTIGDAMRKIRDNDLSVIAVIDKEKKLLFPVYRKDLLKLLNK